VRRWARRAPWLWALALALACSRPETGDAPRPRLELAARFEATPAPDDVGETCADVLDTRACWLGAGPDAVRRVVRPLPSHPSTRGFRCSGRGAERVCEDRRHGSDGLACQGDRCTERHPRLPDDGEWECADLDGAVVCRSWAEAAGAVAGKPDPAWVCGPRAGAPKERICVDFAPERPADEPWSCGFQHDPGQVARVCTRGGPGPLGRACGGGCPFGSACVGERCLPLLPEPRCWIDADCGEGKKCAHGSCRELPR
jgi:hypothetical protein